MPSPDERLAAYYESRAVQDRIAEYCGGSSAGFDAWGLAGYGGRRRLSEREGAPVETSFAELPTLLADGADICRGLADRRGTLLLLDVDYVNPSAPWDAYRNPEAVFQLLEPVYDAIRETLVRRGVDALALMTGRGYHFVALATLSGRFHSALAEIGAAGDRLRSGDRALATERKGTVVLGRAHEGAGRLLEHLAHDVLLRVAGRSPIPVALADVAPPRGGPFVCLDLSAYGDPLSVRYTRCAFSGNQKASMLGITPERPFTIVVPRGGRSLDEMHELRREPENAARLAAAGPCRIPMVPDGAMKWIDAYRGSPLAAFHAEFDLGPHLESADWPFTYDALDLGALPACARLPLQVPNPALLTPVFLRTVALSLWNLGWHPRSVAALIRSRFEKDHDWGDLWERYDPASRADLYVRLFCGGAAVGLETGQSFSCESQELRGVCSRSECGHDLQAEFEEGQARRLGRRAKWGRAGEA